MAAVLLLLLLLGHAAMAAALAASHVEFAELEPAADVPCDPARALTAALPFCNRSLSIEARVTGKRAG